MLDWFYSNETLALWLLTASVISFFATLIAVPIILIKIPQDYFLSEDRHRTSWAKQHTAMRIPLFLIKNILGVIFVIAGILMLALPGQGLLAILIGLVLMDLPGKYHAERWLISRRAVLRASNWIRKKAGRPALLVHQD